MWNKTLPEDITVYLEIELYIIYVFQQVTENTAYILDECGILTTYRGETFVKGAGNIKTYFVPLDTNYNLIKKEHSMDYYRTEDRSRYYHLKNTLFNDDSWTEDDRSESSTYDIRNMSVDEDENEDDDYINNSVRNNHSFDMGASTSNVERNSHASIEHEVIETRCWRLYNINRNIMNGGRWTASNVRWYDDIQKKFLKDFSTLCNMVM